MSRINCKRSSFGYICHIYFDYGRIVMSCNWCDRCYYNNKDRKRTRWPVMRRGRCRGRKEHPVSVSPAVIFININNDLFLHLLPQMILAPHFHRSHDMWSNQYHSCRFYFLAHYLWYPTLARSTWEPRPNYQIILYGKNEPMSTGSAGKSTSHCAIAVLIQNTWQASERILLVKLNVI